ncbi:hypothetical protein RintRC_5709 [Richelia intracellularis]|nr:hypothetical protein RintRC_5709 [Richelia intracellularis]
MLKQCNNAINVNPQWIRKPRKTIGKNKIPPIPKVIQEIMPMGTPITVAQNQTLK